MKYIVINKTGKEILRRENIKKITKLSEKTWQLDYEEKTEKITPGQNMMVITEN